jgi:hypothetical protein
MHNKHSSAATQHIGSKYKDYDAGRATKHVDMVKSIETK